MKLTLEEAYELTDSGGSLNLQGTQITALPDNLTVGGWLNLRDTVITAGAKYKRLNAGDYVYGRYLYADGILSHIKASRRVGDYTLYIGKIKGQNVVSDGKHYAHCDKMRDGIADLLFKSAADRGLEQYKGLNLDSVLAFPEAVNMYRIVTGACRQGTQRFIDGMKDRKDQYTVSGIIDMTEGQYGAERFKAFFLEEGGHPT